MNAHDEFDALLRAAAGSAEELAQMRARVRAGEAAPYVAGRLKFRGREFRMDKRAYITDPEASFFVDVVSAQGRQLQAQLGRPISVLEFGVGAATLGISLKLEHPDWSLAGLDVDADALTLAAENAQLHGVAIDLLQSDYLANWTAQRGVPDLLFGDPPWGDADDLYDGERDGAYYEQMPVLSAFPPGGGRTTIHDELIVRFAKAGWSSLLILNYGILPHDLIARSAAPLVHWQLQHPRPELSVLLGRNG